MRKKIIFAIFIIALNIICKPITALSSPADWLVPYPNTVAARVGRLNPNTDTPDNIHNGGTMFDNGIGLDIMTDSGTPIYAVADGYVVCSNHALNIASDISCERGHAAKFGNGGYGVHAILKCDNEEIVLGHLSTVYVSKGQSVKKGDLIGLSGNTGNSSEPHLHFEIVGKFGQISSLFGKPLSWFVQGAILYGGFNLGGTQPNPDPKPEPDPGQGNDKLFSLHENNNGGGRTEGFSSVPLIINDLQASNWNTLTSLTLHKSGITVKVWRGKDFSGESVTFSSQQTHNLPVEYEKKAGSLKAFTGAEPGTNPSNPTPQPSGLVAFHDANAGKTADGDKWSYYRGIGNASKASEMGFPNDSLSCVEILADGVVVELFENDGYSGRSLKLSDKGKFDLRGDKMNNIDNLTSSYKIYYANEGPVQDTPTPTPTPQPSVSYEVTGVSNVSGTVIVTVTSNSGQNTQIPTSRGVDNCYILKLPDNSRMTIRPEWKISVLDSDPNLVVSREGGELINQGKTIRYGSGQTVIFGTHGGATVSCSFWLTTQDDIPVTPPQQPSPDPDPGDDDDNNDGGTSIEIPDEININGGAGCDSGLGVYAVLMLIIPLFIKKK